VGGRASCESECGRGTLPCGTGRGRGVPVEGVSYESEPERGRGASVELASYETDLSCGLEVGCVVLWLFCFLLSMMWVPHTVGTDSSPRAFG
jgi:hypothetical protein